MVRKGFISENSLAAFLLQEGGAREKLTKENAAGGVSPSADGEKGYAPFTARAFEKARPKPSLILTVRTTFIAAF